MTMTADDRAVSSRQPDLLTHSLSRRSGRGWLGRIVAVLAMLGLGGGLFAAYKYFYGADAGAASRVLTTTVKKADLLITVTEDGNVESANNIELKC